MVDPETVFEVDIMEFSDGTFACGCPHCDAVIEAIFASTCEDRLIDHLNLWHTDYKVGHA
jgi:hypothetical protein